MQSIMQLFIFTLSVLVLAVRESDEEVRAVSQHRNSSKVSHHMNASKVSTHRNASKENGDWPYEISREDYQKSYDFYINEDDGEENVCQYTRIPTQDLCRLWGWESVYNKVFNPVVSTNKKTNIRVDCCKDRDEDTNFIDVFVGENVGENGDWSDENDEKRYEHEEDMYKDEKTLRCTASRTGGADGIVNCNGAPPELSAGDCTRIDELPGYKINEQMYKVDRPNTAHWGTLCCYLCVQQ